MQPLYYIAHHFSIRKECAFYFQTKGGRFFEHKLEQNVEKAT